MSEWFDLVNTTLVQRFEVPAGAVSLDTELEEVLHDSLDVVEFATLIGDRLGIKITDGELDDVQTVADFVALLESKGTRV